MAMCMAALSAGLMEGRLLHYFASTAISKREKPLPSFRLLNGKKALIFWLIVNAGVWLLVLWQFGISLFALKWLFAWSVCAVISAVDACIRKIPNGALLVLFIGALAWMLMEDTWGGALDHLYGLLFGTATFLIPILFNKQAGGAGDVKFAAAMGLYLGLYNTAVALVIMSMLFLLYTTARLLMGKGNFKSAVAMGPAIALGFVISMALSGNIVP